MRLRTKFQDEDFELGEVADVDIVTTTDGRIKARAEAMRGGLHIIFYKTKAEFDADWEDVPEEPKGYWYINEYGTVIKADNYGRDNIYDKSRKEFGNHFSSQKEAEKVVEKLRANQAAEELGISRGNINSCINKHRKTAGGYRWEALPELKIKKGELSNAM